MDMQLRHALLGLLAIRPMSGYDLGRAFAGSVAHFWHADQSQIYRTLDRLSEDGAIATERIRQRDRPDRHVHSLTDAGRVELERWIASPVEVERPKEPFLARMFFAASSGGDVVDRLLDERERLVRSDLERLPAVDAETHDRAESLRAQTVRYGILHGEAELAWIAETRRRNAALPSA